MANQCEVCESIERVTEYRVQYGRVDRTLALCHEHSEPIRSVMTATRTRRVKPLPYIPADEAARRKLGVVKRVRSR